jgi:hypothetical protein
MNVNMKIAFHEAYKDTLVLQVSNGALPDGHYPAAKLEALIGY